MIEIDIETTLAAVERMDLKARKLTSGNQLVSDNNRPSKSNKSPNQNSVGNSESKLQNPEIQDMSNR